MLFRNYSQLCGLGGNFSLEISWRDILASDKEEYVEVCGVWCVVCEMCDRYWRSAGTV